jgi:predicted Ser/Thr protein kinase
LQVKEEIGRGSFGVVYKGVWRESDVAIKQLASKKYSEKELTDFEVEAEVLT